MTKIHFVSAVVFAVLLSGCADVYDHPPPQPTTVLLKLVPADELPKDCGHPGESRVAGCFAASGFLGAPGVITMPVPREGEYAWLDVLEHEVAHANGWRHPAWQGGIE